MTGHRLLPPPSTLLTSTLVLIFLGCNDDRRPAEFYRPPDARVREALTLEPAAETCERWQQVNLAQQQRGASGFAQRLQQEFLLFGLEEIRIDPFTLSPNDEAAHVTASVRGLSRDTILVLTTTPPGDVGNLAPLTAVAKYWSIHADPDAPPQSTVRFAVLPTPNNHSAEQILADYFLKRPRSADQTKAIILLHPSYPASQTEPTEHTDPSVEFGHRTTPIGNSPVTNRTQIATLLENTIPTTALTIAKQGEHVGPAGSLAAALATLDLPLVWLDLGWESTSPKCSGSAISRVAESSEALLNVLQTLTESQLN